MKIRNWLEKFKRSKITPLEFPKAVQTLQEAHSRLELALAEGLACPEFAAEMGRVALGRQQPVLSPLETLLSPQAQQAYQTMMAQMAAPMQGFGGTFLCLGSCQPHRPDPSICNTESPRPRKHVDSVVVPQKCLPEAK